MTETNSSFQSTFMTTLQTFWYIKSMPKTILARFNAQLHRNVNLY